MAGESIQGALLGGAVSELSNVIISAMKKNWHFKTELVEMQHTINSMKPIFEDIEKLNTKLDRRRDETEMFITLLKQAEDLVRNCDGNKWDFLNRDRQASKLDDLNRSLKKFVKFHLQLQICRDTKETLVVVKRGLEAGSSSGWSSGVPLLKCVAIGFDDRVRVLKGMVVKEFVDDDCLVVVVSGVGGSGKTTLVKMLCHDPDIKARFGRNIYFATISKKYDIKVIIKSLLERAQLGKLRDFGSDEVAVQQWGSFLGENESEILLVLDDVWSDSVIKDFMFKSPGYKILVTSRTVFSPFSKYQLRALNDEDATSLFCRSAFSEHSNIPDDLVDKLVKCCKNHPLALSVVGGMLNGARVASWEVMLKKLSEEKKPLLDLDESIKRCLERSLFFFEKEPEMEQCYLDMGLFPEDQKIAATTLMDMWAHLYKHDEEGLDTMDILSKLSSRNLATLLPIRKHIPAIANHCEEEFVTQHDMMRALAIHLSSRESIVDRERLVINLNGQDLPQLSTKIVNARILSISTDERFSLEWNEIQRSRRLHTVDVLEATVFLKSEVVLEVQKNATLLGGTKLEDYLAEQSRWYVVLAEDEEDVEITGDGEINDHVVKVVHDSSFPVQDSSPSPLNCVPIPAVAGLSFVLFYSVNTVLKIIYRMGKDPDPGWTYGTLVEGTKNAVRCNFCFFVSKSGITRHKHHLAWDSPDVARCPKVPNEVKALFKEHFENKKRSREMMNSIPHFDDVVDLDEDDEEDEVEINRSEAKSKGKKPMSSTGSTTDAFNKKAKGTLYSVFKPSVVSGKKGGNLVGSKEYNDVQKKLRLDAVQKFCRWMYVAGVSFNSEKIHCELPLYRRAEGIFGNPMAKKMRAKLAPDAEENDVAAYKDFVPTSAPDDDDDDDDDDEPDFFDVSD
ncbi:hypothetical protein L1987_54843 [Smallanthus sonchifolius]|uniref:Uncharacterized protein n=1 Tax=Smallanthus sonchifolius TaxID=185202 RepID=A0ACB9E8P0_9ASTR|nr:hypothetical protein L1987_54843 [Smallanthus sonchifolius]